MSNMEKNAPGVASITKAAKEFDGLSDKEMVQAINKAYSLACRIQEAKRELESKKEDIEQEEPIPTGEQIKRDYEDGIYR